MTRAEIVKEAISTTENVRGDQRLVLIQEPTLLAGGEALEVWVRLYQGDREVRVDSHRILVNPPTRTVTDDRRGFDLETGRFVERQVKEDPEAAFWTVLWDSIDTTPNRRGWKKP